MLSLPGNTGFRIWNKRYFTVTKQWPVFSVSSVTSVDKITDYFILAPLRKLFFLDGH